MSTYQQKYYEKNKKKILEYMHTPARLNYSREYTKNKRQKIMFEIHKLLGNKCINPFNLPHPEWCSDKKCLCIDHTNNNGRQHRRQFKNLSGYYEAILKEIKAGSKDYQLLCANCNQIKKYKTPISLKN